ncbi:14612_t:CDS:2 [Acaulospora colombiana]|uniref:14612_t:CDS:1 n=1 Tax=Acaulospora colombiana TaxID=27376 RepID=A0ACA9N1X5_9GLOM|nr:14612_t:CDS:2 [Acaulospora colombiana]
MSTLDTNPGSNNAEGWHTRATESTSVTASSFDPKAEDILATFFYDAKGSGDGFTMALMKPNIAVDAAGRILTVSPGDFVGLQEVVDAVKRLPQTDEWGGQWRIKQARTCFGIYPSPSRTRTLDQISKRSKGRLYQGSARRECHSEDISVVVV